MEVFFNELSVRIADDDNEAKAWLIELAKVGQLLKKIIESLQEDSFAFRRKDDFAEMAITASSNIREFLTENFDFTDSEYNFLLGVFDSPYITPEDVDYDEYGNISLIYDGKEYGETGLAASLVKKSLAVSFNNDSSWDVCDLEINVEELNQEVVIEEKVEKVKHASKKQHVIQCHLHFLSNLFDWDSHRPSFDVSTKTQTLLPMLELYSLLLSKEDDWEDFYRGIATKPTTDRIAVINDLVGKIAELHRWEAASGNLATQNRDRTIFIVPNSNLIIGVDTQHGEFEVHRNQKGNNHFGAISFDGSRFKSAIAGRSLNL
ncbi:MAG: hypothetical protein HY842_03635 [Bacteroidetes bacterium]|nr:hypothetical protein [Bacteroidota bacterium]